jgi:hypothetical protein
MGFSFLMSRNKSFGEPRPTFNVSDVFEPQQDTLGARIFRWKDRVE